MQLDLIMQYNVTQKWDCKNKLKKTKTHACVLYRIELNNDVSG